MLTPMMQERKSGYDGEGEFGLERCRGRRRLAGRVMEDPAPQDAAEKTRATFPGQTTGEAGLEEGETWARGAAGD